MGHVGDTEAFPAPVDRPRDKLKHSRNAIGANHKSVVGPYVCNLARTIGTDHGQRVQAD